MSLPDDPVSPALREPQLLGQTVVVIGGQQLVEA